MVALPAIEKGRGQAERVGGFVSVGFLFSEILLSENADVSDHRIFEGSSPKKKSSIQNIQKVSSWWLNHPFEKYERKSTWIISPRIRGEKSKMFETTTHVCNFLHMKKMKNLKTSTECLKHR